MKLLFVDNLFKFIQFEETLLFTCLDIDFNRFKSGDVIDDKALRRITEENLTAAFTCDREVIAASEAKPPTKQEVDMMVLSSYQDP